MPRHVSIHGHFYQPPRENPWLGEVELQDSAYPYHDWNERITVECYGPNTASRILDQEGKVNHIANNFTSISYNFGPTLLSWLERHKPDIYQKILEADRESRKNFSGHGSAIAQCYSHMIMPLANQRDKQTQVLWGVKDFEHRFKRKPEGMWLPEAAVDLETLEQLASHDIVFTILSPHQAKRMRKIGDTQWTDVSEGTIDPKQAYRCTLPSGKSIALFFYDGPVSQEIAFGGLLDNGEHFAQRLFSLFPEETEASRNIPYLVHTATDGETYGHHHPYGDMALAYCLHHINDRDHIKLTIYAEYLEKHPPLHEVEIFENSSWSCIHGVERWKNDCGCGSGGHPGWHQKWRKPLRDALDWVRDTIAPLYEREMKALAHDPWQLRNAYIDIILDRSLENIEQFMSRHGHHVLSQEEKIRFLKLCEMQHTALLMYTSCGFFFDELSSIETTQIIHYAARTIQLAREVSGIDLESEFISMLKLAPSNLPHLLDGAAVYHKFTKSSVIDLMRIGAHYALSSVFKEYPEETMIYSYHIARRSQEHFEIGKQKLIVGKAQVRSLRTWDEEYIQYAVLHLGDHNLTGGVTAYENATSFDSMKNTMKSALSRSDVPEILRLITTQFKEHQYSLWHLLKDEQRMIVNKILSTSLGNIEKSFRHINEDNYPMMQVIRELNMPLPKAFATTLEFILDKDIQQLLESENVDIEELNKLIDEASRWAINLDRKSLSFTVSNKINNIMNHFSRNTTDITPLTTIDTLLSNTRYLQLKLDIWKAQNIYYEISKQLYAVMREKAKQQDAQALEWVAAFEKLGSHLNIRNT